MYRMKSHSRSYESENYNIESISSQENPKKEFHLWKHKDQHSDISRHSSFKEIIDSMFNDTRSAVSECEINKDNLFTTRSECGAQPCFGYRDRFNKSKIRAFGDVRGTDNAKNTVQAKIEKMFADVSSSDVDEEMVVPELLKFDVHHLGSLPLFNKVTSLQGLQEPLKKLYFNYRKIKNPLTRSRGRLEICSRGLKVTSCDNRNMPKEEQINSFASIAVWAALKFVCRPIKKDKRDVDSGLEYAFLPIAFDRQCGDKSELFRPLKRSEISCAMEKTYDDHSPLFVVVMRKKNITAGNNRLSCYGFACATSEDAIYLAASLHKSLVSKTHRNQIGKNDDSDGRKKVKCYNGLGTNASVAGDSICDVDIDYPLREKETDELDENKNRRSNTIVDELKNQFLCSNNKKVALKTNHESENQGVSKESFSLFDLKIKNRNFTDTIIPFDNNKRNFQFDRESMPKNPSVHSRPSMKSDKTESGDILTKIVIPRSGSFLNASGPLTSRYGRYGSGRERIVSDRRNSLRGPLGFIELFNEMRIHEGLNNIDDILNVIINVNGMSFNSLKPIYKEFIFKLAVTLTKDELYQRSKLIMQKQRVKKMKNFGKRKRLAGHSIKRKLHTCLANLRISSSERKIGNPLKNVIIPAIKKIHEKPKQTNGICRKKSKERESNFSLVSANSSKSSIRLNTNPDRRDFLSNFTMSSHRFKDGFSFHKKTTNCRRCDRPLIGGENLDNFIGQKDILHDNKEEISNRLNKNQNNVSGYFSCSECSYDSRSCKYNSLGKCYCSLKRFDNKSKNISEKQYSSFDEPIHQSVCSCSYDTESCIDSDKCYCDSNEKPSAFEQLKQQGFAASESSLSRSNSPMQFTLSKNSSNNENNGKPCLQASKSLEFFHVHKNITGFPLLNYDENNDSNNENSQLFSERRTNYQFHSGNNRHNNYFENRKNQINSKTGFDQFTALGEKGSTFRSDNDFYYSDSNSHFENSEDLFNRGQGNEMNKILVVSTRNEKGKMKNSLAPLFANKYLENKYVREADAISIKKTAEIAALFSERKAEKKSYLNSGGNSDIPYHRFNPFDNFYQSNNHIKNINLENSLGYYP